MKILQRLFSNKAVKGKSFFDYSSGEKKKILREAAIESNKQQNELIKKYSNKCYNFN
jgi:hypothetical protein